MLDSFQRHVTKDSYGPVLFGSQTFKTAVVHKFNDGFSVLNWGRMPDPLRDRGRSSALVFHSLNQRFRSTESWKNFLRSPDALSFRKAGASISQGGNMSVMLNELAERFPMPSNYLGVIGEQEFRVLDQKQPIGPEALMDESLPQTSGMLYPVCEYLPEEKIPHAMVMGRTVWDFNTWKSLPSPKRLPFEIECHFTLNEESLRRLKTDAVSIPKTASLHTLQAGTSWDFPLIELIMSQDPLERRLGLTEALAMSGFSPEQLQELLLTAAWVSAWARFQMKTFTLESIRLRFAMDLNGQWKLYDGFTMDDLYLEQNGIRFHTDTALDFYSKTSWYESVVHARKHSAVFGLADWKRLCVEPSPWLDPKFKANLEERIRMAAEGLAGKV